MLRLPALLPIFFLSLFLPSKSYSQDASEVTFITYWNKGDVFNYEIVSGRKKYRDEVMIDSTASEKRYSLQVVDSTKDDYLIEVNYQALNMAEYKSLGIEDTQLDALLKKYADLKLLFKIDSLGTFLGIQQAEALQQFTGELIDLMLAGEKYRESSLTPEQKTALRETFSSSQYVIGKTLDNVKMMHQFFGATFQLDTVMYYEDELSNLFGGDPIPADCSIGFYMYDEEENLVQIVQNINVTPENTKEILKLFVEKIRLNNDDVNDSVETLELSIADRNIFWIDADFGVVVGMMRERTVDTGDGNKTVDYTEVFLVD